MRDERVGCGAVERPDEQRPAQRRQLLPCPPDGQVQRGTLGQEGRGRPELHRDRRRARHGVAEGGEHAVEVGLADVHRRNEGDVRWDPLDVGVARRPTERVDLDGDASGEEERHGEVPAGHGAAPYRSPRRRGQRALEVVA